MKRVLVTQRGLLGRQVLPLLAGAGFEIHAVGRRPVDKGVTPQIADLLAGDAVAEVVERVRPTHLLHLAWYVEHQKFWNAPDNVRWVEASLSLLRAFAAQGGKRVVSAGSCAEYGIGAMGYAAKARHPAVRPLSTGRRSTVCN